VPQMLWGTARTCAQCACLRCNDASFSGQGQPTYRRDMSCIRCFQVDAFTTRPFAGNPAAVFLLDREADAGWMQSVAGEMNLSETAFVAHMADGFGLRWFTPKVEVDLCGH